MYYILFNTESKQVHYSSVSTQPLSQLFRKYTLVYVVGLMFAETMAIVYLTFLSAWFSSVLGSFITDCIIKYENGKLRL